MTEGFLQILPGWLVVMLTLVVLSSVWLSACATFWWWTLRRGAWCGDQRAVQPRWFRSATRLPLLDVEGFEREVDGWTAGGLVGGQEAFLTAVDQRLKPIRRLSNLLVLGGLAMTMVGLLGITRELPSALRASDVDLLANSMGNLMVAFSSTLAGLIGVVPVRVLLIFSEVAARKAAAKRLDPDHGVSDTFGPLERSARHLERSSVSLSRLVGDDEREGVASLGQVARALGESVATFGEGADLWAAQWSEWRSEMVEHSKRQTAEHAAMECRFLEMYRVLDQSVTRIGDLLREAGEQHVENLVEIAKVQDSAAAKLSERIELAADQQKEMFQTATNRQERLWLGAATRHEEVSKGATEQYEKLWAMATGHLRKHLDEVNQHSREQLALQRGLQQNMADLAAASKAIDGAASTIDGVVDATLLKHREELERAGKTLRDAFEGPDARSREAWEGAASALNTVGADLTALLEDLRAEREASRSANIRLAGSASGLDNALRSLTETQQRLRDGTEIMKAAIRHLGHLLRIEDEHPDRRPQAIGGTGSASRDPQ